MRVLVLDRRPVIATEICRSMSRRGYAVDLVAERNSPAFYSRSCSRKFIIPSCKSGAAFLKALREVTLSEHYEAIFLCNEEVLEAILRVPECGVPSGLPLAPRGTLRVALSKSAMIEVAREIGVAVPRTIVPGGESEVYSAASELGFPVVVKGDRGESGERVRIACSHDEMLSAYREIANLELADGFRPSLQEYVRGVAYSVGGLFSGGRPLRVCAHRKLVTFPPTGGLTVSGVTDNCPALLEEAFKIFAAIEYTGLGHVEFIRDSDGRFWFIEVNPRVWGTVGVGEYAGVDFFTPYVSLARGERPEADLRFRPGVRFHRIGREARMLRVCPTRVFGFVRDCFDPRVRSDFLWRDPLPHLVSLATRGFTGSRIADGVREVM